MPRVLHVPMLALPSPENSHLDVLPLFAPSLRLLSPTFLNFDSIPHLVIAFSLSEARLPHPTSIPGQTILAHAHGKLTRILSKAYDFLLKSLSPKGTRTVVMGHQKGNKKASEVSVWHQNPEATRKA